MKKNKVMRLASCLLVAVLLTTCMISGTFAKYATSIEFGGSNLGAGQGGGSSAGVAKFQITLNKTDITAGTPNNFKINFLDNVWDTVNANYQSGVGVKDKEVADNRIAPGTWGQAASTTLGEDTPENTVEGFVITNNSEVVVQYTISLELIDRTPGSSTEGKALVLPVEFSLDGGKHWNTAVSSSGGGSGTAGEYSISGILGIGANTKDATYGAEGDTAPGDGKLLWRWAFTDTTNADKMIARDKLDTAIGIAAAGTVNADGTVTEAAFDFVLHVMVEQVD